MLCHLLTKLELTASASMAQRLTDDCVSQWVNIHLFIIEKLPEKIQEKYHGKSQMLLHSNRSPHQTTHYGNSNVYLYNSNVYLYTITLL